MRTSEVHSGILDRERYPMPRKRTSAYNPKTFLTEVGSGKTIKAFEKNHVIFSQGDTADAVFYIEEGKVKLTVLSKQGKEAVVAILEHGGFFGEACLIGQAVRMATATAIENCTVVRIDKLTMLRVLRQKPAFSEMFMSHLLARNIRIEEDLVDQLFNSSEKRL